MTFLLSCFTFLDYPAYISPSLSFSSSFSPHSLYINPLYLTHSSFPLFYFFIPFFSLLISITFLYINTFHRSLLSLLHFFIPFFSLFLFSTFPLHLPLLSLLHFSIPFSSQLIFFTFPYINPLSLLYFLHPSLSPAHFLPLPLYPLRPPPPPSSLLTPLRTALSDPFRLHYFFANELLSLSPQHPLPPRGRTQLGLWRHGSALPGRGEWAWEKARWGCDKVGMGLGMG